jgi:hypothetical protein
MIREAHLKILKHKESNPHISQRKLAEELGLSVGKVNYCVKALIPKGPANAGIHFKPCSMLKWIEAFATKTRFSFSGHIQSILISTAELSC